jgi:hypothetical protein
MPGGSQIDRFTRSPAFASLVLIVLLVIGCLGTRVGYSYLTLVGKAYQSAKNGFQERLPTHLFYDETYMVLRYIVDQTPEDAVILLPPRQFIIDKYHDGSIPLLASPSTAYSFIHPRVPVHFGDVSPRKDDITHLLVWEHWALDRMGLTPDESNGIGVYEWPEGQKAPW